MLSAKAEGCDVNVRAWRLKRRGVADVGIAVGGGVVVGTSCPASHSKPLYNNKRTQQTAFKIVIPAHEGRSPTYGAKSETQPGADVRVADKAQETSLAAEAEERGGDEEQGGGGEGGHVSQSVHCEVSADGVADDHEYVVGVLGGNDDDGGVVVVMVMAVVEVVEVAMCGDAP
jgi:hypothetical protein